MTFQSVLPAIEQGRMDESLAVSAQAGPDSELGRALAEARATVGVA